jgi:16S rRNA (cytosine1402-N4)-methyltransferase
VPPYAHKPVMVVEVLEALRPLDGGRYVDGTLGGAGHAALILQRSGPTGWLFGCDRDGDAIEAAHERLAAFAGRFELRRGTFDRLGEWLAPGSCDGVLLDLGVSSHQVDVAARGFSFQQDGPLDMRMDRQQELTAADLVNRASAAELTRWFRDLGDERHARRIARAIEQERATHRLTTTGELARLIERVCPRGGGRAHPATRAFQALRMAVNRELECLEAGLQAAWTVLKPGGRLAVLSFHSGEDRLVKEFGRAGERDYEVTGAVDMPDLRRPRAPLLRRITRKALQPSAAEVAENPRARSVQLRVLEKV